jgi:hypothetical protein
MRLRDLFENGEDSGANGGSSKGGRKSLHKSQKSAIPGMTSYPDTPAHYYNMYRFGMHMAGSPGEQDMPADGPTANELTTVAYTKAEQEIIDKSRKAMGWDKTKKITSAGSKEHHDTSSVSPVAQWNKTK